MAGNVHYAEGWEYNHSDEYVDNHPGGIGAATLTTTGGYLNNGGHIVVFTGSGRYHTVDFPEIGPSFGVAIVCGTRVLGDNKQLFNLMYNAVEEISVWINASNQVEVKRGATILDTSTETVTDTGWHKFYLEVTLNNSTGSFTLYMDHSSICSGSGIDTSSGNNLKINQVRVSNASRAHDHLVIFTSAASVPTDDWLVQKILPDGAGNYSDLTPSAGSNYQNVDDPTADGDGTHNESATVTDRDSYSHADVGEAITGTVLAIITRQWIKNVGPGTRKTKPFFRISATDYDGAEFTPSTDYSLVDQQVFDENPATVANWTSGEVTAIEAGMLVNA